MYLGRHASSPCWHATSVVSAERCAFGVPHPNRQSHCPTTLNRHRLFTPCTTLADNPRNALPSSQMVVMNESCIVVTRAKCLTITVVPLRVLHMYVRRHPMYARLSPNQHSPLGDCDCLPNLPHITSRPPLNRHRSSRM